MNGVVTYYVSRTYQITNGVVAKYYGSYAMRSGSNLYYLLSDHLGSTSITLDANGGKIAELRYKAFGETRYTKNNTPTDYRYTGQLQQAEIGLYFYNARWYDPVLGRFVQADTIVSGGIQGYDRYAYVGNNPINFNDPTGHKIACHTTYQAGREIPECTGHPDPWAPPPGVLDKMSDTNNSYNRYYDLFSHAGWWNGHQAYNFTVWQYLNLLLSMEHSGDAGKAIPSGVWDETHLRNFYLNCTNSPDHCDPTSELDVLRWIAVTDLDYSSQRDVSPQSLNDNEADIKTSQNPANFSDAFLNHNPAWESGCGTLGECCRIR